MTIPEFKRNLFEHTQITEDYVSKLTDGDFEKIISIYEDIYAKRPTVKAAYAGIAFIIGCKVEGFSRDEVMRMVREVAHDTEGKLKNEDEADWLITKTRFDID